MISQQDMNNYKTQMQDQMAIQTFVDKLIEERKDPEVTAETLPAVRSLLIKKVNEAVNEHFISLLNDAEVAELDTLLEANASDAQLNDFFRSKIDTISIEIAAALLNFRAAYLYPVWKKQQEAASPKQEAPQEQKTEDIDQLPPAPAM